MVYVLKTSFQTHKGFSNRSPAYGFLPCDSFRARDSFFEVLPFPSSGNALHKMMFNEFKEVGQWTNECIQDGAHFIPAHLLLP